MLTNYVYCTYVRVNCSIVFQFASVPLKIMVFIIIFFHINTYFQISMFSTGWRKFIFLFLLFLFHFEYNNRLPVSKVYSKILFSIAICLGADTHGAHEIAIDCWSFVTEVRSRFLWYHIILQGKIFSALGLSFRNPDASLHFDQNHTWAAPSLTHPPIHPISPSFCCLSNQQQLL